MPRRITIVLAVLCAAVFAATAGANSWPPPEFHPQVADTALAKRLSLRRTDLAKGWFQLPRAQTRAAVPLCGAYPRELSTLRLTGREDRSFVLAGTQAEASSRVDVFASAAQAQKNWSFAASGAGLQCIGSSFETPGSHVLSVRHTHGPRTGDTSMKLHFVVGVKAGASILRLHLDLFVIRAGRAVVTLATSSPNRSPKGGELVAIHMLDRLGRPAV